MASWINLYTAKAMKHTLALDIGGTNFSVALFEGETLKCKATRQTNRLGGPEWMLGEMERLVSSWNLNTELDSCGIGFGGPVDSRSQRILFSTHVEGWADYDLVAEVKKRFGVSAVVDRDTMVGALAEGTYGAGQGVRPLFYITLSTGIGGGLLTDCGLYHGANSYACELGHHCVLPDGPQCICGSFGCLERMCCGLWLERDFGREAKELFEDPEFVKGYVVNLARGIKNCIMLLNPARIVIGGGISKSGDRLFPPLRAELEKQVTSWSRAAIDVVPAGLGGDSVLWGALALAREGFYRK